MAGVRLNLSFGLTNTATTTVRRSPELSSSYSWNPLSVAARRSRSKSKKRSRGGGLVIVSELGGQYEEGFDDVRKVILLSLSLLTSKFVCSNPLVDCNLLTRIEILRSTVSYDITKVFRSMMWKLSQFFFFWMSID